MSNSLARFKGGFHLPFRFEIVVGSLTVDLVGGKNNIYMSAWRPVSPGYKGGGTYQDTPLVDNSQLVDKRFENVEEIIEFNIDANDPDTAIYSSRQLRIALEECANYWTQKWNESVGYLLVQNTRESNIRYAVIMKGRMPEDEYPFGQMVVQPNGRCLWADLACSIEHLPWQETIPATGTALSIGTVNCYNVVKNGSFETWTATPTNWTSFSSPTLTQNTNLNFVRTGKRSVLIAAASGTRGIRQDIGNLWPGTITVTVWVWVLSGTATLALQPNGGGAALDSDATAVTGQWVQLSATGLIANIGVRVILTIATGSAYFEDAEFNLCFGNLDNNLVLERVTTDNEVFIVNKHNIAQLTHVYIYDGTVWTDNRVEAGPGNFSGTADGAIYFGIDTTFQDSGPFNNLVFDIGTLVSATTVETIWEYWDGANWVTLTTRDNTDVGTGAFTILGVGSVHWTPPTDWAAVDLSTAALGAAAITGFWVRAIVTGVTGTVTPAAQISRPVYTVTWPYVEIDSDQCGGDIDMLLQQILYNRSDNTPDVPLTGYDAVYCGLRSMSRGEDFSAFINIADEQNRVGITVAATAGSFAAQVQAPSGRWQTWTSPGSAGATTTVTTVTIDHLTALQYFGRFHAYLRVDDDIGNDFPISLRIKLNDIVRYQTPFVKTTVADGEMLDMGELVIDPGTILPSELPEIKIEILVKQAAATVLRFYDLIILPVDEWAVAIDIQSRFTARQVYIDSIGNPKQLIRAKSVDVVTTNEVKDAKTPRANGPAILHRTGDQRLWFLFLLDDDALTFAQTFVVSNTIQLNRSKRYLSARGSG